MKLNDMQSKLMAVARKNPPSNRVPYAFEKRIMSRVTAVTPLNTWALWAGPLWRAAVSCVAITILCGVWSFASHRQTESQESFSQAFEAAVVTPPSQSTEGAW